MAASLVAAPVSFAASLVACPASFMSCPASWATAAPQLSPTPSPAASRIRVIPIIFMVRSSRLMRVSVICVDSPIPAEDVRGFANDSSPNGNCSLKCVYFSRSHIFSFRFKQPGLRSSNRAGGMETQSRCMQPQSLPLFIRRHPADPSGPSRSRHPVALFRNGDLYRLLRKGLDQHQRTVLSGRPGDVGVDRRAQLRLCESWVPRVDGMGGRCLPVRHSRDSLVLDRRDSRDAVPGHRDDAVLLHLEDALRPRLPAASLRRGCAGFVRRVVRVHDGADVRRQHVLHGAGDEGGAGLEH